MADLETIVAYLLGEGELDGKWFGDPDVPMVAGKYKARYWWRTHLREAWNNRHGSGDAEDSARLDWLEQSKYDLVVGPTGKWHILSAPTDNPGYPTAREAIDAARAGERG
jgi:hypothetical protein